MNDSTSILTLIKDLKGAVARIQQNHALEHATLHILSQMNHQGRIAGVSDPNGFHIVGNVKKDVLAKAVEKALEELQAGNSALAIHHNCGTNLLTKSLAIWLGVQLIFPTKKRQGFQRFVALIAGAFTIWYGVNHGQALGLTAQKWITTNANLTGVSVIGFQEYSIGSKTIQRVIVGQSDD